MQGLLQTSPRWIILCHSDERHMISKALQLIAEGLFIYNEYGLYRRYNYCFVLFTQEPQGIL